METRVKEIIAPFTGKDAASITAETSLDRNALKSSIHVHRMYARLASQGFEVVDYSNVNTFADLIQTLNLSTGNEVENIPMKRNLSIPMPDSSTSGVGIDIEEVEALPKTSDYRAHEFFVNNFTPEEISHCILQSNPPASFAGLFAAKEAMMKANSEMKRMPFNTISIQHTKEGKPFYGTMDISISHTATVAVAVAILQPLQIVDKSSGHENVAVNNDRRHVSLFISVVALIVAVVVLILQLR